MSDSKNISFVCSDCGGSNISRDALVTWSANTQKWVFDGEAIQDSMCCGDCGCETVIEAPYFGPVTSDVLADFEIVDWRVSEGEDLPIAHSAPYRFLIQQSPASKAVFFSLYPKVLDDLSTVIPLVGLAGCIEIGGGVPRISLGRDENDLPVHVECLDETSFFIHTDGGIKISNSSELVGLSDHVSVGQRFQVMQPGWLMEARSDIANKMFGDFDFKDLLVVDDGGWEIEGTHWKKKVFFENNDDGGDSLLGYFEMEFSDEGLVVLFMSGGLLNG